MGDAFCRSHSMAERGYSFRRIAVMASSLQYGCSVAQRYPGQTFRQLVFQLSWAFRAIGCSFPASVGLAVLLFSTSAMAVRRGGPEQKTPGYRAMRIDVDATQVGRRLIHSHLEIPVESGPVTVSYPLWSPGDHAPFQHVGQIADLQFRAAGQVLKWRRDLVDVDAFHLEVPRGVRSIEADFDFLLPVPGDALADSSARLLMLRWSLYTLYVAGRPMRNIPVNASVKLPEGWKFSTALPVQEMNGNEVQFQQASLETIIDSPVLSGEFMRKIPLLPTEPHVHEMDVAAESEADLPEASAIAAKYGRLVVQARRMLGPEHFRGYHFLIAASDFTSPGEGFEHGESSDDRVHGNFFHDASHKDVMEDLLAHEYAHSWNGKYRRPADLYPVDYQTPEKTDLLWVYESLTDFLGITLASRSDFCTEAAQREYWAAIAAKVDHETGRTWRNMQDTADSVPLTMEELFLGPPGWDSWLRMLDYYEEGALIWLEVDTIIEAQTQGKRSIDDFLQAFYSGDGGVATVRTYTEADVLAALQQVAPYDWKSFFEERLNSHAPHAPLGGLERSGWKLVYNAQPNTFLQSARPNGLGGMMFSVGMAIGSDGTINDVLRGGPADGVGMVPGMKILQIDGEGWSAAAFLHAIAKAGADDAREPIHLQARFADVTREFAVNYHGGLRYPHLQRIEAVQDRLTRLGTAR